MAHHKKPQNHHHAYMRAQSLPNPSPNWVIFNALASTSNKHNVHWNPDWQANHI